MTTENNSVNSNSDFGLLNQRNGWLNSELDSYQCGCIVCQGTAITGIEHQQYSDNTEIALLEVSTQNLQTASLKLDQTFKLHSNPNAKHTIYLDFDGHITENTVWKNGERIESPAYDTDGNVNSFSDTEKQKIQSIWQRIAEDFAPFEINVTTESPSIEDLRKTGDDDERWGVRVVYTQDDETQIRPGAAGVAFIGSFNYSTDTPVFAFNGAAFVGSHEAGHALGLSHDGRFATDDQPGQGIYRHPDRTWGAIVGAAGSIYQWTKGEYYLASNTEDDLEIITTQNGFGYRVDDYGDTNATAFELTPTNNTVSAFGIIERNTDIDVFSFVTGGGNVSFRIDPSSRVYISDGNGNYTPEYLNSNRPNLDILAKLYSADGTLIAESNPLYDPSKFNLFSSLSASFDLNLDAGEYYIHIDGTGAGDPFSEENPTGYTDYGSLGQYEINGTVVAPPDDLVGVKATDASKNEGDSGITTFTFTVTRSGNTSAGTTVDWQVKTANGNSADVNDFVGGVFPSGTINFAAGETSREITLEISGEQDIELDENFVVQLSNLSRGTLAPDAAIGTILSDDAEIRGMKWYDSNQNGVKDTNESGLANWTIFLDENENGLLDDGEITTTTGNDGSYTFNVNPGTYSVLEVLKPGWQQTFPKLQGEETYQLDDGSGVSLEYSHQGDVALFNIFETKANFETLNFISVGLSSEVNPTKLFVYQDLDDDNNPDGNEKLLEVETNFTETSGFGTIAIEPTIVNGTFFIGALYEGNNSENTSVLFDTTIRGSKTLVALQNTFDPSNPFTFPSRGFNGMIRAHSGAIPQQVIVNAGEVVTDINFGNYIQLPTVGVTAIDNTAAESGDTATFRISRTEDISNQLTVNYTIAGTATNGNDYSNLTGSVTIAAGETDADITITPTDDILVEADESVILTLINDAAYNLDSNATATATITDNDTTGIIISDSSGDSDDAAIKFTTALSQFRNGTSDSDLVRPSYGDNKQYFDITNSGDAALNISEVRINASGVTHNLDFSQGDIVLNPNQSQRVQLTYTPIQAGEDFNLSNGIVVVGNATNSSETLINLSLSGKSTFESDINYDGLVSFGDLGPLNANWGRDDQSNNWDPTADINGDGLVSFGDLGLLNQQWNQTLG